MGQPGFLDDAMRAFAIGRARTSISARRMRTRVHTLILHNRILHNGLCPPCSRKEMKNEALLLSPPTPIPLFSPLFPSFPLFPPRFSDAYHFSRFIHFASPFSSDSSAYVSFFQHPSRLRVHSRRVSRDYDRSSRVRYRKTYRWTSSARRL